MQVSGTVYRTYNTVHAQLKACQMSYSHLCVVFPD